MSWKNIKHKKSLSGGLALCTVMYSIHTQTLEMREEKQVTCADTTNIIKQFVNGFASQSLQFV